MIYNKYGFSKHIKDAKSVYPDGTIVDVEYYVKDLKQKENYNMIKVLFATGNETKAKRFSKGLEEKGIEVITLKDISKEIEVEENGKDAIENALIKARAYAKIINMTVFAMEDNLY